MTLTSRRAPLASLAPAVQGEVRGDEGTMVTDVVLDTRKVVPGALFCCVPGARVDGHDLAGKALDAGAAALCVQRPLDLEALGCDQFAPAEPGRHDGEDDDPDQ
jgi:UDP-N-acetylmuramyl pentapeptide synthase